MILPRILKNSALYSITTLLQKSIAFVLLPLYTAFLTPEDYGTVNVVLAVSSFMAVLIMMALNGAATRFHYSNSEQSYRKLLWGTITTIVVANSIGWGALFFILHRILVDPFIGDIDFYPYAVLALANTVITPLYLLFQSYLQASQKALQYNLITFSNFVIHALLAILLIAYFRLGALGMLLANVGTSLLFFLYVLVVFVPKITIGFNRAITKASMKYSLPLLPHQISIWSAGSIDRLFLNDIKGEGATGLFSVAQQFGAVVGTIAYSVNQAFVPWFFETIEKGKEGISKIQQMGNGMVLAYCLMAFVISFFAPEILSFMVSENFWEAWKIIPLISFAFVFHGLYFFFINVLFLKNTGMVFWVTFSGMVVDVIANILLVPIWGYYGCGIACMMTYFTRSLFALILSRRKNKDIKYDYVTMYGYTFLLFFLSYTSFLLIDIPVLWAFVIKVFTCLILMMWFYVKYHQVIRSFLATRRS